jgi:hypothetical protein
MGAENEEALVKVKMVLRMTSGTSVIMNRLCTIVTLVMNKSCTFSYLITNHTPLSSLPQMTYTSKFVVILRKEHGVFEKMWHFNTWSP